MELPETKDAKVLHPLLQASLDRIDSSIGYIEGNVEFVCLFINLSKNSFSRQEFTTTINKVIANERFRKYK